MTVNFEQDVKIQKVAIFGAGLMGHGIAQIAAQVAGYDVVLCDVNEQLLDSGVKFIKANLERSVEEVELQKVLGKIRVTTNAVAAVEEADLIIEAIPERIDLKENLFRMISKSSRCEAIIVSNTSSLGISCLASYVSHPERFAGFHFFNPPQKIRLVEIITGERTSDNTLTVLFDVAKRMGKEPVLVKKDTAGFIINRLLIPTLNEAVSLVRSGIASREDIDKAVELALNWPMGPLRLLDYIGIDTVLFICKNLEAELGPMYAPDPLLKEMVDSGKLGKKSGQGFYCWK